MTNVYGTDGRPFRAVGIIEDITAQREAERRFAEEEQFRAAMLSKAITSYEVNVSQNRLIDRACPGIGVRPLDENLTPYP